MATLLISRPSCATSAAIADVGSGQKRSLTTFGVFVVRTFGTAETIEKALGEGGKAGFLPPFPYGTDFTDVEQRLLPALQLLKSASPFQLFTALLLGSAGVVDYDCMKRMGLERPSCPMEWFYAHLLSGALWRSRRHSL